MKPKYRFVLRVLLYSVPLYFVGQLLLGWYAPALTAGLTRSGSRSLAPKNLSDFLYAPSMAVIAFCALLLATPKMPLARKAAMLGLGISSFVLTDVLFIEYAKAAAPLGDDSVGVELYLCVKSLLAWVLWLGMSYPYLGKLFVSGRDTPVG